MRASTASRSWRSRCIRILSSTTRKRCCGCAKQYPENVNRFGVLNFAFTKEELPEASETFRAVGYGHSAGQWKAILQAYMDVDFEGMFSIENEDPILSGEVGVERAAYVLKNVRSEILG